MSKSRKRCSTCGRNRLVKFFWKNSSKKDGLQSDCSDCKRKKFKSYYEANTERHRQSVYERRERVRDELRALIFDHLSDHPCVDCGESDVLLLEFDHVKGTKIMGISEMVSEARSVSVVKKEMAKCVVRCSHCHIRKTAEERQTWMWRRVNGLLTS